MSSGYLFGSKTDLRGQESKYSPRSAAGHKEEVGQSGGNVAPTVSDILQQSTEVSLILLPSHTTNLFFFFSHCFSSESQTDLITFNM